jgi:phage protein D
MPIPLFNGVITHHQVAPGDAPGQAVLTVTAEDVSFLLDRIEVNKPYKNLADFAIVSQVLLQHAQHGVMSPHVIVPTQQVRSETDYVVRQHETDLAFVKRLAKQNGFTFYLEPGAFGVSHAYWGPQVRTGTPQPALTTNMGEWTNVRSLSFTADARLPVQANGRFLDPVSKAPSPIPTMPQARAPLAAAPMPAQREIFLRDTAPATSADASVKARAAELDVEDPVSGSGELDTVKYGHVLRPRRMVGVRGAGHAHDGLYYVRRVTHILARGEYTQRFTIAREGRGSLVPVVAP